MSAELLRRAAKALREHAEAATPAAWESYDDGLVWCEPARLGGPVSDSTELGDAHYIALMHPPVAVALADWLEVAAVSQDAGVEAEKYVGLEPGATRMPLDDRADALARAVLREGAPDAA